MTETLSTDQLWSAVHSERAALLDDLQLLDDDAWATPSLCAEWTVEDVVAHLTAAASIGRFRWLGSMLAARFNPAVHNKRRLLEHKGRTPRETLARFRQIVDSTTAASGHTPAWLGEVVVHAADIRRPLGIEHTPPLMVVTPVAQFFASRDFTVSSASLIEGLSLVATDGPFRTETGLAVSGTTLDLTMAMAGRGAYLDDLTGPGVPTLHDRIDAPAAESR